MLIVNAVGQPLTWDVNLKLSTGIRLEADMIIWIDDQIKLKRFANRSHAIELALELLREVMQRNQQGIQS